MGVVTGALCIAAVSLTTLHAQAPLPDNVPQTPRPPAPGTSPALDSARAARGATLQVVLYTYGPGPEVFEKFGHVALAIEDTQTGESIAYNWGMFDFNQPNFLARFLTGDTKYWMAGYRTGEFNAMYQSQDRTIRQQRLNLTPMQRGALSDLVSWNAREENAYYRYDYYNDNCSTRVRDALDWALGGVVRQALDTVDGHFTWRNETARITAENLPVYAGIQLALGRTADRHLTRWQLAFLPERFADDLARTAVGGASLVAHDSVLYATQSLPTLVHVPQRTMPALALGMVLGVAVFALARLAPALLSAFGVLWYGAGGVLGTALLLAGTVTKHIPYMGSNLNLTLVSPLLLVAALFWSWRTRDDAKGRSGRALSAVVAGIAVVGLVLEHLPALSQGSIMVFMTVVPVHVALAIVANRRLRRAPSATP
ncbi:hypothetical protein GEMMAAP_06755 [Gemmatimonas phototrophica]|uniref:Lnb N-terminal periplasmic domain-containing protein n=2 Tax=Gemmatimonas phototrophica TaxID=1379270 RepID=A0A143BHW0_9BACT|nr:hypothetical protein GEMMAAP_06755 [Gemmatimonas phototrophica]